MENVPIIDGWDESLPVVAYASSVSEAERKVAEMNKAAPGRYFVGVVGVI